MSCDAAWQFGFDPGGGRIASVTPAGLRPGERVARVVADATQTGAVSKFHRWRSPAQSGDRARKARIATRPTTTKPSSSDEGTFAFPLRRSSSCATGLTNGRLGGAILSHEALALVGKVRRVPEFGRPSGAGSKNN